MLWMFVLAGTAGIVLAVPPVMRVLEGHAASEQSFVPTFAGFVLAAGAITGLFVMQFEVRNVITIVAAAAVGIAVGALHPEMLSSLGTRTHDRIIEDVLDDTTTQTGESVDQ